MLVTMGHTTTATLLLVWTAIITLPCGTSVNVALNKSYTQSSTSSSQQGANAGADNDIDTCVFTRSEAQYLDHPWYEVDLGRLYPVDAIHLAADHNRLSPSNITIDGETCGTAIGSGTWKYVRCSEVMYGQNVRVTLDRTDQPLSLCEFRIYVSSGVDDCLAGQFGPTCDLECNNNCGQGPGKNFCYEYSGQCYDRCVEGWYGRHCSIPCSSCPHGDCDSQRKQCTCHTGYTGDYCEACYDGRYGDECEYSCPATYCQQCDQFTGVCSNCIPASFLQTPNCTDCIDGYYKPEGQKWCIQCWWICKSGTVCDQTTGHCPACPPGKQGDRCDQVCDPGWYGEDCVEECGHCANDEPCQPETGKCAGGCEDGWKDTDLCKADSSEKDCDPGWYGEDCAEECGHCANGDPCDPETGKCAGGCEDGWKDTDLCKEESNSEGSTAKQEDNDNTAVIAGSMGAGLVILVIITIILICIIVRRRRQQPAHSRQSTDEDTTEMSSIPRDKGLTKNDGQYIYPQQEGYVNAAQVLDDGVYENTGGIYSELATSSQHDGTYTGLAKT